MFKFMLIFHHPEDIVGFENHYQELLALVERMPEITRRQVIHVTGSPAGRSPYYRILEVYYVDQQAMNRSLRSAAGQEAGAEIQKFAADSFEMAFAEVYEENGGSTPSVMPSTDETSTDDRSATTDGTPTIL
jgi:uncharacterized protein (TIGR02118 family)